METLSSEQMNRNDHALIDAENLHFSLANSVKRELETLHPLSNECCIYRAPKTLRELNEKSYTPQLVSIGPLHHGKKELLPMEEHKKRYLQDFLQRTEVSVENFVLFIKKREEKLRNCYAEAIRLGSDDFVKMILVDSTFIIEVLLRTSFPKFRKSIDRIFRKPWMIHHIRFDIWLLENQLPFFILEDLFHLANIATFSLDDGRPPLIFLIHGFYKISWPFDILDDLLVKNPSPVVEHFVDFLRICYEPRKSSPRNIVKSLSTPSVTKLQQYGVKFKYGSSKNMFDISFNNGILEIPKLFINPHTEILFRNLLAFEDCHSKNKYIADYVCVMTYLVNGPKDVELLVQNGILVNWNWKSEGVASLFQNVAGPTSIYINNFYFAGLVEDLNGYCKSSWHKWKATLKQDYFSTPWAVISVIVAFILLVLTFIQTVCSIISV